MRTGFHLRPYRVEDEDAAIALWLATWQQAFPAIDFAARVPWWRERWRNELVPKADIIVAEAAGVLAGFVTIDATGYLDQLVVDPGHWGSELGDTRKSAAVQSEAAGADLLVHEALSPTLVRVLQDSAARAGRKNLQKIFGDILDYHATPEEAAAVARDAKVGMLLLNHIVPAPPVPGMEQTFVGDAAKIYSGPIHVGNDGDFVSLPAGSGAIEFGRRGTL